jgi:transposase
VRKWIHRFNRYGLDGLRSGKSPGRPPVFTEEQRNRIVAIASTNPRLLGLHYSRWSLQRLRRYLIEHKIVENISVETIRQILQAQESFAVHRRKRVAE